jgi:tetratricopeptide (TPR) repeat protein
LAEWDAPYACHCLDTPPSLDTYFKACFVKGEDPDAVFRPIYIAGLILFACCSANAGSTTTAKFDSCITYFQDGEYQKAADSLKALLPLIADRTEEAEAYKYLGFSYVMLDMINKAKVFFRVALEKFPQMVIDTLEVPPNIAIVFKQTQLETKMAKGEILDKEVQARNEKRVITATVLTVTGALSSGIGGYYLYRGYNSYHDYQGYSEPDQEVFDSLKAQYSKEYWIGGAAAGIGIVQLGIATWLYFKKPSSKKISMYYRSGEFGLAWHF